MDCLPSRRCRESYCATQDIHSDSNYYPAQNALLQERACRGEFLKLFLWPLFQTSFFAYRATLGTLRWTLIPFW